MEVCNGDGYFPSAHKWCMEKNLTMMGDSDIHAPDLRKKSSPHDHRTITLVFAKERTVPAIKEALQAGRTAVWFKDQIIGRREYLSPVVRQVRVGCAAALTDQEGRLHFNSQRLRLGYRTETNRRPGAHGNSLAGPFDFAC